MLNIFKTFDKLIGETDYVKQLRVDIEKYKLDLSKKIITNK